MPLYILGLIPLSIFFIVRLGWIKSWFILKSIPGILSARMIYMALPLGLAFIAGGVAITFFQYPNPNDAARAFVFAYCPFLILTFVFLAFPPKWIKPKWLQWLEEEYSYCLDILVEEAQQMGRWEWEARVRTQAGMQEWIDEVLARRGLN